MGRGGRGVTEAGTAPPRGCVPGPGAATLRAERAGPGRGRGRARGGGRVRARGAAGGAAPSQGQDLKPAGPCRRAGGRSCCCYSCCWSARCGPACTSGPAAAATGLCVGTEPPSPGSGGPGSGDYPASPPPWGPGAQAPSLTLEGQICCFALGGPTVFHVSGASTSWTASCSRHLGISWGSTVGLAFGGTTSLLVLQDGDPLA